MLVLDYHGAFGKNLSDSELVMALSLVFSLFQNAVLIYNFYILHYFTDYTIFSSFHLLAIN